MTFLDKIQTDLNEALKNKDERKVSVLRLLTAELRNQQIAKQKELIDEDFAEVVAREIKRRKEAAEAYQKGNRQDLAEKENSEAKILQDYLPEQLSEEELKKVVEETIQQTGASGLSDFGKVMGLVMGKAKGKADGNTVAVLVKEMLTS